MNTVSALAEPVSDKRPPMAAAASGYSRLRSAVERTWWESVEYFESAAGRHAIGLVLAGAEKHSGLPLRSLYFGSGNHLAYVRGLLYRECHVESEARNLRVWHSRRWIGQRERDVDIVVADLPWPWHRLMRGRGMIEVPAWVNQRMTLPGYWREVFPKLRRSARGEDMRSIRKHQLEYRLVRDEQAIRRFYEEMYVPHLRRRFGEAAYIEPEWKIRYCVENGTLMEIRREDRLVAAQVLWGNRGSLHFLWAGTTGDEFSAQTRGTFPALYYFGILHAFEQGYDEVDYCGSRPLLTDGIVQLKRRWGASIYDGWSRDTLFFGPRHFEGAIFKFLEGTPLLARSGSGLVGKVFCGAEAVNAEQVARAEQLYSSEGIREIRLYSLIKPSAEALAAAHQVSGVEIVDLSPEPDPVSAYCRS
jgi:hypothetical protein